MKTKILFVITKSNWGGAQRYVYDLATSLPKDSFEAIVALGGSGGRNADVGLLHKKLNENNIQTIQVRHFMRNISFFKELSSFFEIYQIIKKSRPNVVHLNSSKAGGVGALAVRLVSIISYLGPKAYRLAPKIIFTAHGWPFKEERQNYQKWAIYFLSWMTMLLCHKVIAVSKDDENRAPSLFVKNKITLIHNGIAPIEYRDRETARKTVFGEADISEKNLAIGSIAELHKNKGLNFAIEAIADVKKLNADANHPIKWGIIGTGEEKQNLENLVEKLKLKDSVFFFPGYQDNASTLLSAFDLFLLPSLKEGLPYALLEAGSVGLPVIATNVGGASEVITDMETGILIRQAEVKEISYALRFFVQNPDKIREFGGKLKRRISEEFSLKKMLEQTISLYKN